MFRRRWLQGRDVRPPATVSTDRLRTMPPTLIRLKFHLIAPSGYRPITCRVWHPRRRRRPNSPESVTAKKPPGSAGWRLKDWPLGLRRRRAPGAFGPAPGAVIGSGTPRRYAAVGAIGSGGLSPRRSAGGFGTAVVSATGGPRSRRCFSAGGWSRPVVRRWWRGRRGNPTSSR
jgi:hypothetical protein